MSYADLSLLALLVGVMLAALAFLPQHPGGHWTIKQWRPKGYRYLDEHDEQRKRWRKR